MTHFWPEGLPVEVEADALWTPVSFIWERQRCVIDAVVDRWRVDEDWWRGRIWREYFTVTTEARRLVVLFHDLEADAWYVERVYD